jgi:superfamily II DNA or RNA helicase
LTAEVHIHGPVSLIRGEYPFAAVREATSYPVEGAQFSKAYRRGLWDGRKHLLKKATGAFPTGLVPVVLRVCEDASVPVVIEDHREEPTPQNSGFSLHGISMTGKYAYQLDACEKAVKAKQGILKMATNAGKTEVSAAIVNHLGLRTLFIVTTRELMYQAQARYIERLQSDSASIGIVGDGHWSPGSWVTIATVGTLSSRLNTQECQDLLASTEILFLDEAHHTGSEELFTVTTLCPAFYRYGMSGTPLDRTDGANLRLIAATGELIVNVSNKFLVENGISARANIIWDKITTPLLGKRTAYPTAYKKGISENPELLQRVVDWTRVFMQQGLSTLILVEEISQGKILDDYLWTKAEGDFIPHQFIYGAESTDVRKNALEDFGARRLPVLIASTIVDEGVDVPTIDALILAGSRKSRIRTMQRLGRGLRGKNLIVVEFANFCHDYLLKHSMTRLKDYKKEDCFRIYQSGPDENLVKGLWSSY